MNHTFTLQVSGFDAKRDGYENALYEAGCRDALIAVIDGVIYLDFEREGPTFAQAVGSATDAVESAGGRVVRVLPTPE